MVMKKNSLVLLLLLFLSGTFGVSRMGLGINFEIRYLLFIVFILTIVIGISRGTNLKFINKNILPIIIIVGIYLFLSTLSLYYTINPILAFEKYFSIIFTMLLIISCSFLVTNIRAKMFYNIITNFFIFIGFIYVLPVLLSVIFGASRGDVLLSGPNVTTRILFFAALSSLYRYFLGSKSSFFILFTLFLSGVILVGSRGGVVGSITTLTILFSIKILTKPWNFKIPRLTIRNLILFILIVILFFVLYEPVKRVVINRFILSTFVGNGIYTSGRDNIYMYALTMIKNRPFWGYGLDSFTTQTGYVYPHNLLLELLIDVGVAGGIIFLIFVIYSFIVMFRLRKSPLFILSGLPLYMIIVQMFSGEFYDFRYYFLWIIPLLSYGFIEKSDLYLGKIKNINTNKNLA